VRYSLIPTVVAAGLLVLSAAQRTAHADDAETILATECASCHNLTGPAPTTIEGVVKRKAPDLFYAGSKFRRDWLVAWLQEPTRIRPAGTMFLNHIVSQDGKDRIAEETAKLCAARLDADAASAVADHLMTLTDETMKTGIVDPAQKFRMSKARLLFTKQLPCSGCHQMRFGKRVTGGVSGPLLTEAGQRLNPDWIYARIENPQHWDPKTWMPKIGMSHAKRELLTLLIASMK
jgi:cbb3-type cytochrome oxidase cytochrome c subunit